MNCKLCNTRRARRACPGVGGDICAVCCGTERENTVYCPSDCEFLREARTREAEKARDPEQVPHPDIRISEEFLHTNARLGGFLMLALAQAVSAAANIVDYDIREALDGLVRTYRTLQSGLYYESKPSNLIAAGIFDQLKRDVDEYRKAAQQQDGISTIRDADVLGMLVFVLRMEYRINNGRKRGRAFVEFLHANAADVASREAARERSGSSLVVP